MAGRKTYDFTEGSIGGKIFRFSLPLIAVLVLQSLYNMADTIVIGRFVGDLAMGAVGAAGSLVNIVLLLIAGLTQAASVIIAQCKGARDEKGIRTTFSTSIIVSVVVSIILGIVGVIIAPYLCQLMGLEPETARMATIYLRIMFFGAPVTTLYNLGNAISRSMGDSVTPMVVLIVTAILNVFLNIWFVVSFHLDVAGVAYATVLSTAISAVVCFVLIWRKIPMIRPQSKDEIRPDGKIVKLMFKIGVPGALQSSTMAIGAVIMQTLVNDFTTPTFPVLAAYTAATKTEQLISFPPGGISNGLQVFVGQNTGAGKHDRIRKGLSFTMKAILVYSIISGLILAFFGKPLTAIFTSTEATQRIGADYLLLISPFLFFTGVSYTLRTLFIGAGNMKVALINSFLELAVRFAVAYLLAYYTPLGYKGIFLASGISWAASSLHSFICFRMGLWKRKSVMETV